MATLTDRYFEVSDTTVNGRALCSPPLAAVAGHKNEEKSSRTGRFSGRSRQKEMALASGDFESDGRPFGL